MGCCADSQPCSQLDLIEGKVLGGGAFSRVSKVVEESNQRPYALKRMRKATVLQCPEHVFCEQVITRNTAHPFCIRQVCALFTHVPDTRRTAHPFCRRQVCAHLARIPHASRQVRVLAIQGGSAADGVWLQGKEALSRQVCVTEQRGTVAAWCPRWRRGVWLQGKGALSRHDVRGGTCSLSSVATAT